jgi:hypothetical protein
MLATYNSFEKWFRLQKVVVFIYEGIISDLIGFDDHDLSLVIIDSHTHIGVKFLEDS